MTLLSTFNPYFEKQLCWTNQEEAYLHPEANYRWPENEPNAMVMLRTGVQYKLNNKAPKHIL